MVLLSVWTLAILLTHAGERSPYTTSTTAETRVANADALTVLPVTRFFYDGTLPHFPTAHNLKLPLHSFSVATAAAFVRSYPVANYLVNALALVLLIIAAVRLASAFGIRPEASFIALATILALPPFVGYVGQPMQYIVGPVVNFLLVMTAVAMRREQLSNPVIAGAIVAVFAINYDPYVFIGAFILLLVTTRFERRRDDLIFVTIAFGPPAAWHAFLSYISEGTISEAVRQHFHYAILVEWAAFAEAPFRRILLPFISSHIGVHIAFHQVVAIVYWPVLLCCMAALWIARPRIVSHHGGRLAILLVAVYFAEQLVTAAFDWENNPRRAYPVFLTFAFAYTWVVDRFYGQRAWRFAFAGLLVLTAALSFSDFLFGQRGIGYLYSGEAIRRAPKSALAVVESQDPPRRPLGRQQAELHSRVGRAARVPGPEFLFAQLFVGAAVIAFFTLLARAGLVSPRAPAAAALVIVASAIRFVI